MKKFKLFACVFVIIASLFFGSAVYAENRDVEGFAVSPISQELFSYMQGKTYKSDCTVPLNDLRLVEIKHHTRAGEVKQGRIVCNKAIAEDVKEIFAELFEAGYPIEKVKLMDDYDADDEKAMEDNNTSSFNFRVIANTNKISKHGLGLAIDLNTLYNPYVKVKTDGNMIIQPKNATAYIDRTASFPYKIDREDLAYKVFKAHGFEWGGDWTSVKDYQHFELPDSEVAKLYKR